MPKLLTPMQDAQLDHPAQSRRGHSEDEEIRVAGYEIAYRPNKGPVLWKLKTDKSVRPKLYNQATILRMLTLDSGKSQK